MVHGTMKKLIALLVVLFCFSSPAMAACDGVFAAGQFCASIGGGFPQAVSPVPAILGSMALQSSNGVAITGGTITGLPSPSNASDAATKQYVDNTSAGLIVHTQASFATAAALPANTYSNGSSGVGATLVGNVNGALAVDGIFVSSSQRIVIKNEATPANNGIYSVTATGSPSTQYVLTRTTDANTPGTGNVNEIGYGTYVFVTNGNVNANSGWSVNSTVTTIGTSAINWVQFSASANTTVSNSDGSLTISPTAGNVVASLNVSHSNTWTAAQTFLLSGGTTANITLDTPSTSQVANINFRSNGTTKWQMGKDSTSDQFYLYDFGASRYDMTVQPSGNMALMPNAPNNTVVVGTASSATTTAQPAVSVNKSETISGTDTSGAQNAALWVLVEGNNTTHAGGGAPVTQSNGIRSQVVQNGTGGAVSFFGIAQGGADINAAFGAYLNVTATHFPGGAIGLGTDIINSSGSDMPWSAFVPGTSSAALGVDFAAGGANLNTAAVEMRNGGAQWDVGIGAYGNSVKTALIEDDSSSATILNATGSHTNGINLSGATLSGNAFRSTGFILTGTGAISAVLPAAATNEALCYNTSNGAFSINPGTCNTSSMRFKYDIRPLTNTQPDPLDAVSRMNPVSFLYNENQHAPGEQLGLIAENLEAIDPRLVSYDKEGKPDSIRYLGPMFAYMIGAIKELKADNDNLRAEVKRLSRKH
jgi:hypothetical protein